MQFLDEVRGQGLDATPINLVRPGFRSFDIVAGLAIVGGWKEAISISKLRTDAATYRLAPGMQFNSQEETP